MRLLLMISLFFLAGCLDGEKKGNNEKKLENKKVKRVMVKKEFEREKSSSARKLIRQLGDQKKNMVFSPMSLEYALGILSLTAKGEDLSKIAKFLEVPENDIEMHLQSVLEAFEEIDQEGRIKIANLVMLKDTLQANETRLNNLNEKLKIKFQKVDFVNNTENVVSDLNDWISKNTLGKINNLVTKLDKASIFVIANAIYFKMDWMDAFDEKFFEYRPFYKIDSTKVDVEMLSDNKHYEYADFAEGQAVSIPFRSSKFSMWLMKPKKDLDALLAKIESSSFNEILEKKYYQKVNLKVPRFRIENKLNLIDRLKSMGLESLTRSPNYNLGEFFEKKEDIVINQVIQGNFFDFNEKGVEAAAATVIGGVAGGPPPSDVPIDLFFDKPFFFAVYHKESGRFMFLGQVYEPK